MGMLSDQYAWHEDALTAAMFTLGSCFLVQFVRVLPDAWKLPWFVVAMIPMLVGFIITVRAVRWLRKRRRASDDSRS